MSILFCTPCYGGQCTAGYLRSVLKLKESLTEQEMAHDWNIATNESLITRARNEMAATFLRTEYERLMWIDADIEFSPDDVADLWNLDADIAVGVYPMKLPDKQWYAAWVDGKLVKDLDQFGGPIEVDYAGTGFMMIKRMVFLKMIGAFPETEYEGPDGKVFALYNTPVVDQLFESEDYHFCRRWRTLGGKIVMDPSIRLLHHGAYAYGR